MKTALAAALLVIGTAPAWAADALDGLCSPLALVRFGAPGEPGPILAQRAIEREWPAPGDSGFLALPGERNEAFAMMLSAAAPGAGQLYAGERRGLAFLAAEVVGWVGWALLRRDSDDAREEARMLAGSPEDSASAWSFERWEEATQEDPAYIRSLYVADREAFEEAIGEDPRYEAGWSDPAVKTRFDDLREESGRREGQARVAEGALWVNHLVAALDAVRAARAHNLPLRDGLGIKARGGWRRDGPSLTLALERRF